MQNTNSKKITAVILIVHIALLYGCFMVLQSVFDFPDILRKSTDEIFSLFHKNRAAIIPAYYGFTLSGVTFVLISLFAYRALKKTDRDILFVAAILGTICGLLQSMGFVRWAFLIPVLDNHLHNTSLTQSGKESIELILDSFHTYAGVGLGENLGYVFQGLWTILFSVALLKHQAFGKWFGRVGIICGAGLLVYSLEQFGGIFSSLEIVSIVVQSLWVSWLIVIASVFYKMNNEDETAPAPGKVVLTISVLVFLSAVIPSLM
jgi:hypothetical protein